MLFQIIAILCLVLVAMSTTENCFRLFDTDLSYRARTGRINTVEGTMRWYSKRKLHQHLPIKVHNSTFSYVYIPKAGSTIVRSFLGGRFKLTCDLRPPVFSIVRHPLSRVVSAYGTINARAIAQILLNNHLTTLSSFKRFVESVPTIPRGEVVHESHVWRLPFFRVWTAHGRFRQFIVDIASYGFFDMHLVSQAFRLFSACPLGHALPVVLRVESIADDLANSAAIPDFGPWTAFRRAILKAFGCTQRRNVLWKVSKGVGNVDELRFTLSKSEVGKELLKLVFNSSALSLLDTVREEDTVARIQTLYAQDFVCFGYLMD